jgi:outer membrane protein TolC
MTVSPIVLALTLAQAQVGVGAGTPAQSAPAAPDGQPLPTLTLEEALKEADKNNLDLKVWQARLDQAHEISKKAWAGYLPQITAGASYTRNQYPADFKQPTRLWIRTAPGNQQNGPPSDPDNPDLGAPSDNILVPDPTSIQTIVIQKRNQLGAQLQVNQAVIVPYLWPAISNSYLAEKVAELTVASARNDILFGVVQLYYGAVGLKEALTVQQRLLENSRAHERDASVRVEAGAAPKISLIRAQIDRTRAEEDVRRAQFAFDSARVALTTLLDRADARFDVVHPAELPVPQNPGGLEKTAMQRRPDLAVARENTELAQKTSNAVWYNYLPNVYFRGLYQVGNIQGFTGASGSWALTLSLNWTLWDGGIRESQLRENAAKAREADFNQRAAMTRARDEVRRSILDMESAQANRAKADEQARLARENMQLVTVNFNSGVATQLDVADATTALTNAELGLVTERLNAELAVVRLMKAAGEFNPQ